jgi:hypothetical protein
MLAQVRGLVPPGFNTIDFAKDVCQRLYEGYTVNQIVDALVLLGVERPAVYQFVGSAVVTYCYEEYSAALPDGVVEWDAVTLG